MGKNIILAVHSLEGGGAEKFVITMSEAFLAQGYQPYIVCFKSGVSFAVPEGVGYILINYKWFRVFTKLFRDKVIAKFFDWYLAKKLGDIRAVLSNLTVVDKIMQHSSNNVVHVIHNTVSQEGRFANISAKKRAKSIRLLSNIYKDTPSVCVSQGALDDYKTHVAHHTNMVAILNPIDQVKIEKMSVEKVSDIPNFDYLLHVGRFTPQKRHDILLQAYALTSRKYPLVLLGTGSLIEQTKALANSLGITDKVIFLGFKKNSYPYIKHAKFLVLSSDYEGCPLVLGEALALGVTVVSTDCPSGPNELLPADNLVPTNNPQLLADKIEEVFNGANLAIPEFPQQLLPANVARQYIEFIDKSYYSN